MYVHSHIHMYKNIVEFILSVCAIQVILFHIHRDITLSKSSVVVFLVFVVYLSFECFSLSAAVETASGLLLSDTRQ